MILLQELLEYKNEEVVSSFQKKYRLTREESETVFEDTLRFFWLCLHTEREGFNELAIIDHPLTIIDEMWHNFILHTRAFSSKLF